MSRYSWYSDTYRITDECIACGACVRECPVDAINECQDGYYYCINTDICIVCGSCVEICPVDAIIQVDNR